MIIPAWAKWLSAMMIVAAVAAAVYGYGQQQFGRGETAEKARWLDRENKELAEANSKIKTLEEQYRAQEQLHAERLAEISGQYQKDLKHAKTEKDRIIAGLRGGTFRLRIPVADAYQAGGSGAAETASAASGRDGAARGELSPAAAEFLVGLAAECDEVAHQLAAAQRVIIESRETQP